MKPGLYHVLICPSCLRPVAWLTESSVQPLGFYRPYFVTRYTPHRTTRESGSCTCPSAWDRWWSLPSDPFERTYTAEIFAVSGLSFERLPLVSTAIWWKPWTWKNVRWHSEAADRLAAAQAAILHSKLEPALPKEKP